MTIAGLSRRKVRHAISNDPVLIRTHTQQLLRNMIDMMHAMPEPVGSSERALNRLLWHASPHLVNVLVHHQLLTGGSSTACDNVEHTGGEASLHGQLSQSQARQGRLLCHLQHKQTLLVGPTRTALLC